MVSGKELSGIIRCQLDGCDMRSASHEISVGNTKSFIDEISKAKVFNPFVVIAAYSRVLNGVPKGNGHVFKLN